jgi:hypothetical protein
MIKSEHLLCSALHVNDGQEHVHQPRNIKHGFVICGRRHHNCYALARAMGYVDIIKLPVIQGFLTSADRFLDRKAALVMALNVGQVPADFKKRELFSEDLW